MALPFDNIDGSLPLTLPSRSVPGAWLLMHATWYLTIVFVCMQPWSWTGKGLSSRHFD